MSSAARLVSALASMAGVAVASAAACTLNVAGSDSDGTNLAGDASRSADTSGADGESLVSLADVQEIIKKAIGFKSDRDEIQVTQVKVPIVTSAAFDEEWATHQRWQTILTVIRNSSIAMVTLCGCVIAWVVFRRRAKLAPAVTPEAAPEKLQQITEELDRNPEILAKILSRWLESSESSDRVAA